MQVTILDAEVEYILDYKVFNPEDLTTVPGNYIPYDGSQYFQWIGLGQSAATTDSAGSSLATWIAKNWQAAPFTLFDRNDTMFPWTAPVVGMQGSIPYGLDSFGGNYYESFNNLAKGTGADATSFKRTGLIGFAFGIYDDVTASPPQPIAGGLSAAFLEEGETPDDLYYWYPSKSPLTERWIFDATDDTWGMIGYDGVNWNPNGIMTLGGMKANGLTRYFNDFDYAISREGTASYAKVLGGSVTNSAPTSDPGKATFDYFPISTWNSANASFGYKDDYAVIGLARDVNGTRGLSIYGWNGRDTFWAAAWASQYLGESGLEHNWIAPGTVSLILHITYDDNLEPTGFTIVKALGTITELGLDDFIEKGYGFDTTNAVWSAYYNYMINLPAYPTVEGPSVWWYRETRHDINRRRRVRHLKPKPSFLFFPVFTFNSGQYQNLSTRRIVCVIVLTFILCLSSLSSVCASGLGLGEGATLIYAVTRVGTSGQGSYTTWNSSITILDINQTSLVFLSNSTFEDSSINSTITISYKDGIPAHADYLTALFYLPPECIAQSQRGNLEWTTQMSTRTQADVTNGTSQALNFTVPAGNFQSINITLTLTGMDYGTLMFIYDLASGILLFEEWVPSYGDIFTLSLTSETVASEAGSILLDLVLPTAVLAIPVVMGIDKASKKLRRRGHGHDVQPDGGGPKEDLRRVFYITLAGALIGLASVLLPWGQLLGIQMYLPLSLPLVFTDSTALLTPIMLTVSLAAHAAAVLAWASLAVIVYTKRRLAPRLVAVASGVLAFFAASLFIGAGWILSWGSLTIVVAGIFVIAGAVAMRTNSNANAR